MAGNDIEYPFSDIIPENLPYLKKRCLPIGPGNSKDQKMLNRSNEVRASPSCRLLKPSEGKLAEHEIPAYRA